MNNIHKSGDEEMVSLKWHIWGLIAVRDMFWRLHMCFALKKVKWTTGYSYLTTDKFHQSISVFAVIKQETICKFCFPFQYLVLTNIFYLHFITKSSNLFLIMLIVVRMINLQEKCFEWLCPCTCSCMLSTMCNLNAVNHFGMLYFNIIKMYCFQHSLILLNSVPAGWGNKTIIFVLVQVIFLPEGCFVSMI